MPGRRVAIRDTTFSVAAANSSLSPTDFICCREALTPARGMFLEDVTYSIDRRIIEAF